MTDRYLSVLFLVAIVYPASAFVKPYDDGCRWYTDIVDATTLDLLPAVNPSKPFVNFTTVLRNMTVDFLNDRITQYNESFLGYPYLLKINIRCPDRVDETEIINMGLANSNPRVVMRLTIYDENVLSVKKRLMVDMEGVLVYISALSQLNGTDPAQEDMPEARNDTQPDIRPLTDVSFPYSMWFAPIPTNTSMYSIDVKIHSPRVGAPRNEKHFRIYIDDYRSSNSSQFDNSILSVAQLTPNISLTLPRRINTLTSFPLPMLLTGSCSTPQAGSTSCTDLLIYTPNEGLSYTPYQFDTPPSSSASPICGSGYSILSHAVLHDRILLATNYGLVQILSKTASRKFPNIPKQDVIISDKCVYRIILPEINSFNGAFVTVIADDEVRISPYFMPDGKFVFTTFLKDFCAGLKNALPNGNSYSSCNLSNAFEVSNNSAAFQATMTNNDSTKQPLNCIVQYTKSNDTKYLGSWTLRSCLPTYLPLTDPNMPFTVVSENLTIASTGRATVVRGIQQRDVGSNEYYAYGNGLFYSSDGGVSWIYFHKFLAVTGGATPVSRTIQSIHVSRAEGRFIAMPVVVDYTTPVLEIWVARWGQPDIYRLYPSYEWELSQFLLSDNKSDITEWTTYTGNSRVELGVFFDSLGNLQQVFAYLVSTTTYSTNTSNSTNSTDSTNSTNITDSTNSTNSTNSKNSTWHLKTLKFPYEELIPAVYTVKMDLFTDEKTALLKGNANACPQMTIKLNNRQYMERLEYFRFLRPQTRQDDYFKHPEVVTVYSTIVKSLIDTAMSDIGQNYTSTPSGYSELVSGYFLNSPYPNKWQFEKILARSNPRRILLVKEDFEDMTVHDDNVIFSDFPNEIYIDRFGVVSVTVSIYDIKVTGAFGSGDTLTGFPKVGFHMINGSLLTGNVSVEYEPETSVVQYIVTLMESGSLQQDLPGGPLISDVLSITVPQPIDCFPNKDVYEMTVYVGCRPSVQLQFDWELLANKTARGFHDCDDPKERQPCIDHSANVPIFLRQMDYATNLGSNFTGPFRLEVIGFSVGDPSNITRFPQADIVQYNTDFADGSNKGKVIWVPATEDTDWSSKNGRILNYQHNIIQFICQSSSPCGDPSIGIFEEPKLNFLIRVSNKDLPASDTYCLFELEFVIRLRGANPNPYTISIPVFVITLAVLLILAILYILVYFRRVSVAKQYAAYKKKMREEAAKDGSQDSFFRTDRKASYRSFRASKVNRAPSVAVPAGR